MLQPETKPPVKILDARAITAATLPRLTSPCSFVEQSIRASMPRSPCDSAGTGLLKRFFVEVAKAAEDLSAFDLVQRANLVT